MIYLEPAVICVFFVCSVSANDYFIYKQLPHRQLLEARNVGNKIHNEFLNATIDTNDELRMDVYDEHLSKCNLLGEERKRLIQQSIEHLKGKTQYKLLLAAGLQPFVARFLSLPNPLLRDGIDSICARFEEQLQCQYGFGENRTQIENRVAKMKVENGHLKILLENMCAKIHVDYNAYTCLGENPMEWAKPCLKDMLNYNYTRYSAGRRIARTHMKYVNLVANLTESSNENLQMNLRNVATQVQGIMKEGLLKITEIEAEKCERLDAVMQCILPNIQKTCGLEARNTMETVVLGGYLPRERKEILQLHFEGFQVPSHPVCLNLNADI